MSHRPDHITGDLAATWQSLYDEAQAAGIDPEAQPLVVKDESRYGALEALAAVGGAEVTDSEGGKAVRLAFGAEVEDEEHGAPEVTAAAKPHRFADAPGDNPTN